MATEVGGIPELIHSKCGILVPAGNAHRLVSGLVDALDRVWNEGDIAACFSRSWHDWARETYEVCCEAVRHSATSLPFAGQTLRCQTVSAC